MFRTTSSLTRRFSRWSAPTSLHSSGKSTPSFESASSASICASKALFVPSLSIAFSLSNACTRCWALWKTSGIVVVVVWPMGGRRDRWDSKTERASNISLR